MKHKYLLLAVLLALVSITSIMELKAKEYQPITTRNYTEVEKAKIYLYQKVNYKFNTYKKLEAIAQAESSWKLDATNKNKNGTKDTGIYQINSCHKETAKKLNYDINTYQGNIDFAVYLYNTSGDKPWYSSKHNWSKIYATNSHI